MMKPMIKMTKPTVVEELNVRRNLNWNYLLFFTMVLTRKAIATIVRAKNQRSRK